MTMLRHIVSIEDRGIRATFVSIEDACHSAVAMYKLLASRQPDNRTSQLVTIEAFVNDRLTIVRSVGANDTGDSLFLSIVRSFDEELPSTPPAGEST